ncbi:hypothetical protein D3C80_1408700 [compost metagenome]
MSLRSIFNNAGAEGSSPLEGRALNSLADWLINPLKCRVNIFFDLRTQGSNGLPFGVTTGMIFKAKGYLLRIMMFQVISLSVCEGDRR